MRIRKSFSFSKYHGLGNDFIMLNNIKRDIPVKLSEKTINKMCSRRFGIGADGLISIERPDNNTSDIVMFKMVYFNADGKQGSLCGNGARCALAFAYKNGIVPGDREIYFSAFDGQHSGIVETNTGLITVKMANVTHVDVKQNGDYFIDTGSPHHIIWLGESMSINEYDITGVGRNIRYSNTYRPIGGANVNIAQAKGGVILARTYERGVEDETSACGTGVTAVAISAHYVQDKCGACTRENPSCEMETDEEIDFSVHSDNYICGKVYRKIITTKGGKLEVGYKHEYGPVFTNMYLKGPATEVYSGKIDTAKL